MRCNRLTRLPAGSLLAATLLLAGCSLTADEGPTVDYRSAESTKSLEVPPDLTGPSSNRGLSVDGGDDTGVDDSASASAERSGGTGDLDGAGGNEVLPEFDNVRFVRAGGSSWLEVEELDPASLWPRVERFVEQQGLAVRRQEPALGIIETNWAERRDGPRSGGLTGWISGVLGGGTDIVRDRYNIRLERMEGGGTRVFVAHQMAQEIDTEVNPRNVSTFEWVRGGSDPSMEAEMARRLLVHLGVSGPRSETLVADARDPLEGAVRYVAEEGTAALMVDDSNQRRVFARVGDGLTRIGADIGSSEPERGVYVFDWRPPKGSVENGGFLGLFGGGEPDTRRLQLQLSRDSDGVRIKAADEDGLPRSGEVHRVLLRELAVAMGGDKSLVEDLPGREPEERERRGESGDGTYTAPDGPQF